MRTIDGSRGEGGGQVLRTALALSLVTGAPFRIVKMRANRPRPGLMRQHLTAVRAAAEISRADVAGGTVGSQEVTFRPGPVKAGEYTFAVGTAGSATLVFETVLPALALAGGPSSVALEGGTHNPLAPPFDFLERAFLPLLARMGPRVAVHLERPGFYPAGGGRFTAALEPVAAFARLDLVERGAIRGRRSVGLADAHGPAKAIVIDVESEHVTEVFTGFGEKGVAFEAVARAAAAEVEEYLASGAPVGAHLADQLLLPLAIARGGRFRTLPPSRHTTTEIDVIREFLPVEVASTRVSERVHEIEIKER